MAIRLSVAAGARGAGTSQHGLPSEKMARITSDCSIMRGP